MSWSGARFLGDPRVLEEEDDLFVPRQGTHSPVAPPHDLFYQPPAPQPRYPPPPPPHRLRHPYSFHHPHPRPHLSSSRFESSDDDSSDFEDTDGDCEFYSDAFARAFPAPPPSPAASPARAFPNPPPRAHTIENEFELLERWLMEQHGFPELDLRRSVAIGEKYDDGHRQGPAMRESSIFTDEDLEEDEMYIDPHTLFVRPRSTLMQHRDPPPITLSGHGTNVGAVIEAGKTMVAQDDPERTPRARPCVPHLSIPHPQRFGPGCGRTPSPICLGAPAIGGRDEDGRGEDRENEKDDAQLRSPGPKSLAVPSPCSATSISSGRESTPASPLQTRPSMAAPRALTAAEFARISPLVIPRPICAALPPSSPTSPSSPASAGSGPRRDESATPVPRRPLPLRLEQSSLAGSRFAVSTPSASLVDCSGSYASTYGFASSRGVSNAASASGLSLSTTVTSASTSTSSSGGFSFTTTSASDPYGRSEQFVPASPTSACTSPPTSPVKPHPPSSMSRHLSPHPHPYTKTQPLQSKPRAASHSPQGSWRSASSNEPLPRLNIPSNASTPGSPISSPTSPSTSTFAFFQSSPGSLASSGGSNGRDPPPFLHSTSPRAPSPPNSAGRKFRRWWAAVDLSRVDLPRALTPASTKRRKLVVSGVRGNDVEGFKAVRRWCEHFGELARFERDERGSIHVHFRKAEVADMVCRVRGNVNIDGIGSVQLSWYTGRRPL